MWNALQYCSVNTGFSGISSVSLEIPAGGSASNAITPELESLAKLPNYRLGNRIKSNFVERGSLHAPQSNRDLTWESI